jgi:hypothetical protein
MKRIMFIRWGENGPESSPQSEPGDNTEAWLPCVIASLDGFNPETHEIRYHRVGATVTQYIVPSSPVPLEE